MSNYTSDRNPSGTSVGQVCPGEIVTYSFRRVDATQAEITAAGSHPTLPGLAITLPTMGDSGAKLIYYVDGPYVANPFDTAISVAIVGGLNNVKYVVDVQRWKPADSALLRRSYTLTYYSVAALGVYAVPRGARSVRVNSNVTGTFALRGSAGMTMPMGAGIDYSLGAIGALSDPDGAPNRAESADSGASTVTIGGVALATSMSWMVDICPI